jgi:cold shock CspA family protein
VLHSPWALKAASPVLTFLALAHSAGFITRSDGGEDVFVHQARQWTHCPAAFPADSRRLPPQSDLLADGFRSLHEGESVEFKMGSTEAGAWPARGFISCSGDAHEPRACGLHERRCSTLSSHEAQCVSLTPSLLRRAAQSRVCDRAGWSGGEGVYTARRAPWAGQRAASTTFVGVPRPACTL